MFGKDRQSAARFNIGIVTRSDYVSTFHCVWFFFRLSDGMIVFERDRIVTNWNNTRIEKNMFNIRIRISTKGFFFFSDTNFGTVCSLWSFSGELNKISYSLLEIAISLKIFIQS